MTTRFFFPREEGSPKGHYAEGCAQAPGDQKFTSCFDEPRATIVAQDVVKWFRNEYGEDACKADIPASLTAPAATYYQLKNQAIVGLLPCF